MHGRGRPGAGRRPAPAGAPNPGFQRAPGGVSPGQCAAVRRGQCRKCGRCFGKEEAGAATRPRGGSGDGQTLGGSARLGLTIIPGSPERLVNPRGRNFSATMPIIAAPSLRPHRPSSHVSRYYSKPTLQETVNLPHSRCNILWQWVMSQLPIRARCGVHPPPPPGGGGPSWIRAAAAGGGEWTNRPRLPRESERGPRLRGGDRRGARGDRGGAGG